VFKNQKKVKISKEFFSSQFSNLSEFSFIKREKETNPNVIRIKHFIVWFSWLDLFFEGRDAWSKISWNLNQNLLKKNDEQSELTLWKTLDGGLLDKSFLLFKWWKEVFFFKTADPMKDSIKLRSDQVMSFSRLKKMVSEFYFSLFLASLKLPWPLLDALILDGNQRFQAFFKGRFEKLGDSKLLHLGHFLWLEWKMKKVVISPFFPLSKYDWSLERSFQIWTPYSKSLILLHKTLRLNQFKHFGKSNFNFFLFPLVYSQTHEKITFFLLKFD